jgi:beta-ketoacyl-acyl-carrier-protein synthase II
LELRLPSQRVVITGMGAISPLGHTAAELWDGLIGGRSGIAPITQFDASHLPTRFAGEVKNFDPAKWINFKEARRMGRASQLAVATACEALADAGLPIPAPESLQEDIGVVIGTGVGNFDKAEDELLVFRTRGLRASNPLGIAASLANMPAHHVSQLAQAKGPIKVVVAACATGTQAIGEAAEFIRRGAAKIVIAGGVEGVIRDFAIAGFSLMRALSTRNDSPETASRPFDRTRDGFVLSEGCGVVVLEQLDHAKARGARIYAEVLGHASSSDAYHIAAPDPDGAGAVRAMKWALRDARVDPSEVDYINAHGTATQLNDAIETLAIKTLFGEHAYNIPISSTKSIIGHAMGAAGALEAIGMTLAVVTQHVHPTINYHEPDPACDLNYVPNEARSARVRVAISNSFGLGGHNACLVLGQYRNGRS